MGFLRNYFDTNEDRLITKWDHYFDIYERYFTPFRDKEVNILEIGVYHGGSLQMWKRYFGGKAKIYGIDINPECSTYEEEQIQVFIGSQSDRKFLRKLKEQLPKFDIILDDGGHTMSQQIISFQELYSHLKDGGIYMVEDVHTSYWIKYGGGLRRRGTFIEFSKRMVDSIHAYHSRQLLFKPNDYTRTVKSVHFYDSIVVIEKEQVKPPVELASGKMSFENPPKTKTFFLLKVPNYLIKILNVILRFLRLPGVFWK